MIYCLFAWRRQNIFLLTCRHTVVIAFRIEIAPIINGVKKTSRWCISKVNEKRKTVSFIFSNEINKSMYIHPRTRDWLYLVQRCQNALDSFLLVTIESDILWRWFFIIYLFTGPSQVLDSLAQNKLHVRHVQSNPWWLLMTRTLLLTREIGTKKRDITESLHV